MNLNQEICNSFNRHASHYAAAAKIQQEIGQRLSSRLDILRITPKRVLDLGCGTGAFTAMLRKKYPQALIVGLDLSSLMLSEAKKQQRLWRKWPLVQADMQHLPFADQSFDLIYANQSIHWAASMPLLFKELYRILAVSGCLLFSTLGPDTFKELKTSWQDEFAHTNAFLDMHDLGDLLMQQHFNEPVVDMEYISVHYPNLMALVKNLQAQGIRNINPKRNSGLTGKGSWQQFTNSYQQFRTSEGKLPLTYEVVYGIAWKAEKNLDNSVSYVPISQISRRIVS